MSWLENIGKDLPTENITEVFKSQETDEERWRKERLGMITGSNFGKLVVQTRDKKGYTLSKGSTAENLIYKIAWERLLLNGDISNGLGRLSISSKAMQHGNDFEAEAILKYQEVTKRDVVSAQRFLQKDEFIGGTPDGFIGEDGLIEVKCPFNGANHLKSLLEGVVYNSDYVYQMQGYLWVTDRKWCDFVTYDPDLIDGLQLNIIRVPRDEEIIQGIAEVMETVKAKIKEIINNEKLK